MSKSVVGLDFGSTSIRAVEISDPTKPKPTIVRFLEVPLPPNSAVKGEVLEIDTVASALKQLWSKAGFKTKRVIIGVGSQRVIARDMSVPKMPLDRIRESLPFLVQDMLPVPVSEALLDFYPISEGTSKNGPVINGLLIAAVKEAVMANVRAVQQAGLDPVEVDLIPFALTRALVPISAHSNTVVMVHVGAVTTSVVVAKHGVPQFVRIVPSGGDDVSSALISRLEIEPDNAEHVKRVLGLGADEIAPGWMPTVEVIRDVSGELFNSLRNTINFFVNTRPTDPIEAILISGGGAELPGFAAALEEITRIPVMPSDVLDRFSVSPSVDRAALEDVRSRLTVALGLTLGGK